MHVCIGVLTPGTACHLLIHCGAQRQIFVVSVTPVIPLCLQALLVRTRWAGFGLYLARRMPPMSVVLFRFVFEKLICKSNLQTFDSTLATRESYSYCSFFQESKSCFICSHEINGFVHFIWVMWASSASGSCFLLFMFSIMLVVQDS